MPRVLVTGAAGFIGRALVDALLASGFEVTAAVRATGGPAPWQGAVRAVAVGGIDGATDWRAALDGAELVVHLAGIAHQPIAEDDASVARYHAVNVAGTAALATAAAARGVRRLLFLSSVKVNGEETGARPFTERDAPAPQDIYGRSKWQAEQALARIAAETGMAVTVLRSPLVYGPGVGGNFASLLRLCDTPLPLPFGAIDNRRSLIARANLVHAVIACLGHPAAANETFLLRDREDLSTAELARRLRRALGRPARLLPVPPALLTSLGSLLGRGDTMRRLVGSLAVDDGKLCGTVGWHPPRATDEALAETAAAFRSSHAR
jgi:nucleoside-diphosphate-sugar epimerase